MIIDSSPVLATANVRASIRFYEKVLGFSSSWVYQETFGAASLGSATVMFNFQPELVPGVRGLQHWFRLEDIDATHAQHVERGAPIISPLEAKPWGIREYTVEDPSGYHLRFSGQLAGAAKPSQDLPEGLNFEIRIPTPSEYLVIAGAAFDHKKDRSDILDRTWAGIVAMDAGGNAIGMARIMEDAPGWFSIWDVAVLPERQGQRIGSEIMRAALDHIKSVTPSAIVFLFTYQHAFYEKLGFRKDTVTMLRF